MRKIKYYIYKRTNLKNGKIYIGYTQQEPRKRWEQEDKGHQLISKAIQEFGTINFKNEILEVVDSKNKMMEREIYWIHHFDSGNPEKGYNQINAGLDKSNKISGAKRKGIIYIWVSKKLLFNSKKDVLKYLGKLATYLNRPYYCKIENKKSPIWSLMPMTEYNKLVKEGKIELVPKEELTLISYP